MKDSVFPGDTMTAVVNVKNVTNNMKTFLVGVYSKVLFSCTTRDRVIFFNFRKGRTNCFVVFYVYTMTCLVT